MTEIREASLVKGMIPSISGLQGQVGGGAGEWSGGRSLGGWLLGQVVRRVVGWLGEQKGGQVDERWGGWSVGRAVGQSLGGWSVCGRSVCGRSAGGQLAVGRSVGGRSVGGRSVGGWSVGGRPAGGRSGEQVGGHGVSRSVGRAVSQAGWSGSWSVGRSAAFNSLVGPQHFTCPEHLLLTM